MTTYYNLKNDAVLTEEEKREIAEARKKPIIFDEDSPELTDKMKKAFLEARRKKPFGGKKVTVVLSNATVEKAEKVFGEDYSAALGKILDKAVSEYVVNE